MKLRQLVIAALAVSSAATIASANNMPSPSGAQSSSTDVSQAQQALNDKGFNAGAVDGIAGPRTKAALKQFQQQQGLQASGKLDQQTLAALEPGGASPSSGSSQSSSSSQSSDNSQASNSSQSTSPFNPSDTTGQSSQASDTSMSSSPDISQSTSSVGSSQPPSSATASDNSISGSPQAATTPSQSQSQTSSSSGRTY